MYYPDVCNLHSKGRVHDAAGAFEQSHCMSIATATLPGMPQRDDPEPDALPVEPDDGVPPMPGVPEPPGHQPVQPPQA